MFSGENVSVPLYLCMLSSVEIRHRSYFQNNMTMFRFCITVVLQIAGSTFSGILRIVGPGFGPTLVLVGTLIT